MKLIFGSQNFSFFAFFGSLMEMWGTHSVTHTMSIRIVSALANYWINWCKVNMLEHAAVSLCLTRKTFAYVCCVSVVADEGSGRKTIEFLTKYIYTHHTEREICLYIYQQQNRSHVLLSKLNWFRVPRMTRFLHRFSLCVVVVVGHSRPPLPSCAQTLYFVLSFSRCLCLLHILWPHVSPLSLALFHSFILLLFLRFPLYFRASLSLSHSRTQPFVHAVYAQNSLFISSTIVCFSLLFSSWVALGPYHQPSFHTWHRYRYVYKCKYNILH